MSLYPHTRRDEELIGLREELKKKNEELEQLKNLYSQTLQLIDNQKSQLKDYSQQIESIQKEHQKEIASLKNGYEGKIKSLENELYELKPKKPQESKPVYSEKKQKTNLWYDDAINIRNILSNYATNPFADEKDIKESVDNIIKKRAKNYIFGKLTKEEMDQIILALDEGKSDLYKNLNVASSEKKKLAKFVEDREEALRNMISSVTQDKLSLSSVFDTWKLL